MSEDIGPCARVLRLRRPHHDYVRRPGLGRSRFGPMPRLRGTRCRRRFTALAARLDPTPNLKPYAPAGSIFSSYFFFPAQNMQMQPMNK